MSNQNHWQHNNRQQIRLDILSTSLKYWLLYDCCVHLMFTVRFPFVDDNEQRIIRNSIYGCIGGRELRSHITWKLWRWVSALVSPSPSVPPSTSVSSIPPSPLSPPFPLPPFLSPLSLSPSPSLLLSLSPSLPLIPYYTPLLSINYHLLSLPY